MSHHRSIFYCLFLAGPARLAGCGAAADLVHGSSQTLVLPSLLHQVSGAFQRTAAADLVHGSQQALVLPFPLHQVSGAFQRTAAADLVHESPQPLVLSSPLHQVFGHFRLAAAADLVHVSQPLFFRFLCTKSPGLFSARPPRTWCTDPRKTLFFRFLCTKSSDIFGARPPTPPRSSPFLNRRLTSAQFCCIIPSVNFWS